MINWRRAGALVFLASVGACATATHSAGPIDDPFAVLDGGGGNGGAEVSPGGAGAANGGSPTNGGATTGGGGAMNGGGGAMTGGAGAKNGGASMGGSASGGSAMGGAPAGGSSGAHTAGQGGVPGGGASGMVGSGGTAGSAGGGSATPCVSTKDLTGGGSMGLGTTGAVCMRTKETFNSLGCSSFDGRTIKVNGVLAKCDGSKTTFAPAVDGYNYFDVSAGTYSYAAFYWFSS